MHQAFFIPRLQYIRDNTIRNAAADLLDIIINNVRIAIEKDSVSQYLRAVSEKLETGIENIELLKILGKSLDIKNEKQFYYNLSLALRISGDFKNKHEYPLFAEAREPSASKYTIKERPLIVGLGPAGLFAAIELAGRGARPLIFERGRKIEERSRDITDFIKTRKLNGESNIQFGEGGAGSYSDGKLFARVNNSRYADKVLKTFIRFGAPEDIAYVAKPHLGTDVLCKIVRNMRQYLLENGAEIHYGSKMTDLIISDGTASGVVINGADEYLSPIIYLAVGHSARDTFEMLHGKGVAMEQKPIAVGMRLEHPAEIINLMSYGEKYQHNQQIGAMTYSFTYTDREKMRGVYSFCMCPGGEVVNASSENGLLAVNGMSYSDRGLPFSNSAITVTCHTSDYASCNPLSGIAFQKGIERSAFNAGGGNWSAPAQKIEDFLMGKTSKELNPSSYQMGCVPADMRAIFPDFICDTLTLAFRKWKEDYPLFISGHGMLLGAETRTSAPLKILRNADGESINVKNLYPIGEGSGYSGGITSSALDALKAVDAAMNKVL